MIIPDGYAQITHVFSGVAVPNGAVVTHGIDLGARLDHQTQCDEIALAWSSTVLGLQSTFITHDRTEMKLGPNSIGQTFISTRGFPGLVSGDPYSPNCAFLVRKVTSLGGRSGRGRMFVPGLSESQVGSSGNLLGTALTGLQAELDDYYSALVTALADPVLFHTASSNPTPVNTFEVQGRLATQRGRLRR